MIGISLGMVTIELMVSWEFNSISEMGLPQGLFPIETLLSNRPPMLTDYFDESISGIGLFQRPTKILVIQGLEIGTMI